MRLESSRPEGQSDHVDSNTSILEPHPLATRILTRWPVAIIELIGDLSVWEVSALNHEITRIVAAKPNVVVVDLGQTGLISSLGLGMITTLHRSVIRNGGDVRLARPGDHVRIVIERARLDAIFKIYDSLDEAIAG